MLVPLMILFCVLAVITTPGLIALHLEDRRNAAGQVGE